MAEICKEIAGEKLDDPTAIQHATEEIDILAEFCRNRLSGLLDVDADVGTLHMKSPFDIVEWLRSDSTRPLKEHTYAAPVEYEFYYTDEHMKTRADQFKRYGEVDPKIRTGG